MSSDSGTRASDNHRLIQITDQLASTFERIQDLQAFSEPVRLGKITDLKIISEQAQLPDLVLKFEEYGRVIRELERRYPGTPALYNVATLYETCKKALKL